MKLGIVAGYSPATMSVPIDQIKEAESPGLQLGLDGGGLRLRCGLAGGLDPRADGEDLTSAPRSCRCPGARRR